MSGKPYIEDTFWIVWNPDGRNPTVRHSTHASARAEAFRLAQANQEERFIVMESVECFEVNNLILTEQVQP